VEAGNLGQFIGGEALVGLPAKFLVFAHHGIFCIGARRFAFNGHKMARRLNAPRRQGECGFRTDQNERSPTLKADPVRETSKYQGCLDWKQYRISPGMAE
jgi:hypothetical protein